MKKILGILAFLPITLIAQTTHNVAVFGGGFGNPNPQYNPQFLTIDVGDEVVWDNTQGNHNVYGELDIFPNNPAGFSSGTPAFAPWQFSFTFTVPGVYDYHCTEGNHSQTQFGTITVLATPGVEEQTLFGDVSIYPVPAYDQLTVSLGDVRASLFEVLTIDGRRAISTRSFGTDKQVLDLSPLPDGQYFLRITTTNGTVGTVRFNKSN